ncbi:MAG TPA: MoaD/ThiS family protein [Acidobacteriaceae bacterium]|jgi:adenylyltransferase/sulfurtransferase|nr:MoaD/ThiS family protein [Acidobacteriaceae bacterium]
MKIDIPAALRVYTGNLSCVTVRADTIAQAITTLFDQYPEFRKHLYTPEGKLRSFVNLYLNDEDIRYLPEREETQVKEADTLSIIPSIAGGLPG